MNDLTSVLEALSESERHSDLCRVGNWLTTLTPEDEAIANSILDLHVSHDAIRTALQEHMLFSRETIRRHRTGICACR